MHMAQNFKPGDVVRVRDDGTGELSEPAMVQGLYKTSGGLWLDRAVFGYEGWNESDCVPA
jgi:hypothetical protein